jgi:phosphoesterase RecJ-like protein
MWNEEGCPRKIFLSAGAMSSCSVRRPRRSGSTWRWCSDTAVKDPRRHVPSPRSAHADVWGQHRPSRLESALRRSQSHLDAASPATGQILFEMFRRGELPITYAMADNLYVRHQHGHGQLSVSPRPRRATYEIGARVGPAWASMSARLSQRMYESYPRRRLELLMSLLNVLRFTSGDRVASFALTQATAKSLGVKPEDNEGLIDYIRAVEGVIVAAFFEELMDQRVRVSLRSKDPRADVCKIASSLEAAATRSRRASA